MMDISAISAQVSALPLDQQREMLDLLEELSLAKDREKAHGDFLSHQV